MHRHHALLAGAADAWEVAAGLEACGVTDEDARRLRHRDVFGLAEELSARVPRAARSAAPARPRERLGLGPRDAALHLLPGAVLAPAAALHAPVPAAAGLLALAAWPALRSGPLRAARPGRVRAGLAGLALLAALGCGPHALGAAPLAALALTLPLAAWLARWFTRAARAQLGPSHSLADFADAVRPRLLAALAGHAAVLLALLAALGAYRAAAAGVLLFAARLLAAHGAGRTAAAALATAAVAAAGCAALPYGAMAPSLACGVPALAACAAVLRVLPRAAAHRT
ncbi:hypothetical protein [Actinacidiphila yeochonensis]|uniref:hypothetical protein n=1 Tax=Actinacidiphila yeochonensis TaxID=89050 RepID=UPI00055CF269|nr:hypothetical protein [Actinacidiphila yeochonensis]